MIYEQPNILFVGKWNTRLGITVQLQNSTNFICTAYVPDPTVVNDDYVSTLDYLFTFYYGRFN